MRIIIPALILMVLWLVLSGHYTVLLVTFGIISCIGVVALALRLDVIHSDKHSIGILLRLLKYLPWFSREILLSNIDVAKRILSPALPINPNVVRVNASQATELGVTVYANSITLTPGTLSIQVDANQIEVHSLNHESTAQLKRGEMDRRVCALEPRK